MSERRARTSVSVNFDSAAMSRAVLPSPFIASGSAPLQNSFNFVLKDINILKGCSERRCWEILDMRLKEEPSHLVRSSLASVALPLIIQ